MLLVKIIIYCCIFLTCSYIGILKSKKYISRLEELKEFKNALNILKNKIKYTREPLKDVFFDIANGSTSNTGAIFKMAGNNMQLVGAGQAWNLALDAEILNIDNEDVGILKGLSKMLGQTNLEGQISQIELTNSFLDAQIVKAEKERAKSEKLCRTLGMILGISIVIVLI